MTLYVVTTPLTEQSEAAVLLQSISSGDAVVFLLRPDSLFLTALKNKHPTSHFHQLHREDHATDTALESLSAEQWYGLIDEHHHTVTLK